MPCELNGIAIEPSPPMAMTPPAPPNLVNWLFHDDVGCLDYVAARVSHQRGDLMRNCGANEILAMTRR